MNIKGLLTIVLATVMTVGCAGMNRMPTPEQVAVPTPINDNSGKYMSPFTSDDVVAAWVDKAIQAKLGGQVGGMAGAYAGQKLAENIPFVGGFIGQELGDTLGRTVALEAAGGEVYIRETSDLSFNNIDELAVFMYGRFSSHPSYADVLDSTQTIYPELKQRYFYAIQQAAAR